MHSIISISSLQSTAGHRPFQLLVILLDVWLLASSSCQPSCANRHSTWPEAVLHYVYRNVVSTPELVYTNVPIFSIFGSNISWCVVLV
jgi:hypothetical protein